MSCGEWIIMTPNHLSNVEKSFGAYMTALMARLWKAGMQMSYSNISLSIKWSSRNAEDHLNNVGSSVQFSLGFTKSLQMNCFSLNWNVWLMNSTFHLCKKKKENAISLFKSVLFIVTQWSWQLGEESVTKDLLKLSLLSKKGNICGYVWKGQNNTVYSVAEKNRNLFAFWG